MKTRQVQLVRRPTGPVSADVFEVVEAELPDLNHGQVLVRNLFVSVDPYMRAKMTGRSIEQDYALGATFGGAAVGSVVEAGGTDLAVGSLVVSSLGWCEAGVADVDSLEVVAEQPEPSAHLGLLGMPGMTAWAAMRRMAAPQPGQTVLVTAAAGAVGLAAAQLARDAGARVVATTGTAENAAYLRDLGIEEVVNYRTHDLHAALSAAAPDGVDVFLDNVGGATFQAGLRVMATFGRIVVCGSMASLDGDPDAELRLDAFDVRARRLTVQGLVVSDYAAEQDAFRAEITELLSTGRIRNVETRVTGLDAVAPAFVGLFSGGRHIGKLIVEL